MQDDTDIQNAHIADKYFKLQKAVVHYQIIFLSIDDII